MRFATWSHDSGIFKLFLLYTKSTVICNSARNKDKIDKNTTIKENIKTTAKAVDFCRRKLTAEE